MEVITTVTQAHYIVLAILAIISVGIISAIVFKKLQKFKKYQFHKNHALDMDIDKIENAFNETLGHLVDLETFMIQSPIEATNELLREKMLLEIDSIRGIIRHQLGHIPRMRSYLK